MAKKKQVATTRQGRVLVIEQVAGVARDLDFYFSQFGFEVVYASNVADVMSSLSDFDVYFINHFRMNQVIEDAFKHSQLNPVLYTYGLYLNQRDAWSDIKRGAITGFVSQTPVTHSVIAGIEPIMSRRVIPLSLA